MRLLRVAEVAAELSVAPSTVYALIERSGLPHVRFGRSIRGTYEPP